MVEKLALVERDASELAVYVEGSPFLAVLHLVPQAGVPHKLPPKYWLG